MTEQSIMVPIGDLGGDPIVAVDAAVIARIQRLIASARMIEVTDPETFKRADEYNLDLRRFRRTLDDNRKAVKAPVLDLGKRIDAAYREATEGLDEEVLFLSQRIKDYVTRKQSEERAQRLEAERVAREEARRRAEETRQAQRDISAGVAPAPASPVVVPPTVTAAPKPKSMTTRTTKVAVVDDITKIPAWIEHEGKRYELLMPQLAQIRAALDAGAVVPGAHIEEQETFAGKGLS